jgi:hypothetical protein
MIAKRATMDIADRSSIRGTLSTDLHGADATAQGVGLCLQTTHCRSRSAARAWP